MALADLLHGRSSGSRLPSRIDDLRGPASGTVMVPRHLAWPGLREFDLSDVGTRRSVYGMVLAKGERNDVVRLLNPTLLAEDWPAISGAIDPRLRRLCERRFELQSPDQGRRPPDRPGQHRAG